MVFNTYLIFIQNSLFGLILKIDVHEFKFCGKKLRKRLRNEFCLCVGQENRWILVGVVRIHTHAFDIRFSHVK